MTLTLGLENAASGTYCLDDSTPVKFTDTTSIRIGSDYKPGETINLTVTATDGVKTTSTVYKYTKSTAEESGVYVFFNPATKKNWSAPYQVYIYDENTDKGMVYKNANWPGEAMTLDPATGYYYYEVPKSSCISADEDDQNQAASNFDLSSSANTRVIISEKAASSIPAEQMLLSALTVLQRHTHFQRQVLGRIQHLPRQRLRLRLQMLQGYGNRADNRGSDNRSCSCNRSDTAEHKALTAVRQCCLR